MNPSRSRSTTAGRAPVRRSIRRRLAENATAWLFIGPAVVLVGVFGLFPALFTIYVSLFRYRGKPEGKFVGLGNYAELFGPDVRYLAAAVASIAGMVLGADNAGRPFNQLYGRTANVQTWFRGDTNYHSLQAKLDRRFRNGFLLTTSYTLSRAENYSDEAGIATPADVERTFGPAGFDRTHVFASAFIWDLPFFREDRSALGWILGGWQFSGIFTAYSGLPINFTASGATLRAPGNTQYPNVSGEPEVFGDIGPGQLYFDTAAFSAPAQDTWGSLTRNGSIRGPGFWNLDASLVKRLRFGDKVNAELRADAFNLTNTPHFNNPNGSFGQATFGEINSSFGQRLVRFGARVIF